MALTFGPGFRFHPTDEELVVFYLKRKLSGRNSRYDYIGVVDVYKFEPWDLPSMSKLKSGDLEWYFFTSLDRKYGNGSRTNRATERGFWKTTGNDRPVKRGERTVGMKKTLVYHSGRAPRGTRTNWVMHEYRMVDEEFIQSGAVQDSYVLCRIFEKSGSGPKNGESHGAPFREEEWEEAVADDLYLNQLPAIDEVGYIEDQDLEEKLDIGNDALDSSFHYGECSICYEHPYPLINNEKQWVGASVISEPQDSLPSNIEEQHTGVLMDAGNDNLSYEDIPLNIDRTFADLDQFLDVTGDASIVYDEPFLEACDLMMNLDEVNPAEANPSGTEMVNEILTCSGDDIFNIISFDSPPSIGSESPIPEQGLPVIQQNVEGETNDMPLGSQHVFEAQSSNEASPVHDPQASNLVSGDTNPFVKQANRLLASIPAAPAFASEFPTKECALGLHPAAQSSNSAHVTAGMISITGITLGGNAMDWRVGKNGLFDPIFSTGFSQPGLYSAGLMPISCLVSRKTAFVLSHSWIFLMGFSLLIISLTFKIGCFMHSGK